MSRQYQRDPSKEQFWRRMLQKCQHSNLTIRDFCLEHGLSEPSFYAWRRTLDQRDQQDSRSSDRDPKTPTDAKAVFVPVRLVASAATSLEIVLGQGRVIRVTPSFHAATLRQLLAILQEPSC